MALSVKGCLLFKGTASAADMAQLMRDGLECLVGNGMKYEEQDETDLHRSPPTMDRRLADVGVILEDDMSPYVFMLEPRYAPEEKYHYVTVLSGSGLEEDELAVEWRRLALRMRQLAEALRPTAAIAWGHLSAREDEPNIENLALGRPPFDVASWTYLSNELLTGSVTEALARMPGAKTETSGFGRVVELEEPPGRPFDDAVRDWRGGGAQLRFFDPTARS